MTYLRYFLVGTAFGIALFLLLVAIVIVTGHDPKYDLTLFIGVGFLGGIIAAAAVSLQEGLSKNKTDQ